MPANPEALVDEPMPGEGTAIAMPNPTSGEELTSLSAADLNRTQAELTAVIINEERIRARARRRRVFQLAMAMAD